MEGLADFIDFCLGHGREEREAKGAAEGIFGDGEGAGAPGAEFAVGAEGVDGDEVDGDADALFGHALRGFVALDGG